MNEKEKIKSLDKENIRILKVFLQSLEDCYDNKKGLVSCWRLNDIFYNDEKKKKYKWLHIIQLTGLKWTAKEIGEEIGYSASTIENQKELIKNTIIEQFNEWQKPPLILDEYNTDFKDTTPTIRDFAKQYKAPIIILLESLGLNSYISIAETIINEAKVIFNFDLDDN